MTTPYTPYSAGRTVEPTLPKQVVTWPEDIYFAHPAVAVQHSRSGEVSTTRLTICFRVVDDGQTCGLEVGYSFCSPKDCFNKSVGRAKAFARLTEDPFYIPLRAVPTRPLAAQIAMDVLSLAAYAQLDLPGLPRTWALVSKL